LKLAKIAIVVGALATGCSHTKTTDEGVRKPEEQKEEKKEEPAAKPRAGSSHTDADRNGIPLATAPAGLLAPGAEEKIRDRLVAEGFLADDAKRSDAAMSEGLRRFQRARDLPATGVPDDKTVKDLGLDPGEIFRHGPVKD
jgi:hypothetical protein